MLHTDGDLVVGAKRAIEPHDVWGVALVEDLQFPHNLVPHRRLDVQHYHLVVVEKRKKGRETKYGVS